MTNNGKKARTDLSVVERERRADLAKLIDQMELIVKEQGELEGFNAAQVEQARGHFQFNTKLGPLPESSSQRLLHL